MNQSLTYLSHADAYDRLKGLPQTAAQNAAQNAAAMSAFSALERRVLAAQSEDAYDRAMRDAVIYGQGALMPQEVEKQAISQLQLLQQEAGKRAAQQRQDSERMQSGSRSGAAKSPIDALIELLLNQAGQAMGEHRKLILGLAKRAERNSPRLKAHELILADRLDSARGFFETSQQLLDAGAAAGLGPDDLWSHEVLFKVEKEQFALQELMETHKLQRSDVDVFVACEAVKAVCAALLPAAPAQPSKVKPALASFDTLAPRSHQFGGWGASSE